MRTLKEDRVVKGTVAMEDSSEDEHNDKNLENDGFYITIVNEVMTNPKKNGSKAFMVKPQWKAKTLQSLVYGRWSWPPHVHFLKKSNGEVVYPHLTILENALIHNNTVYVGLGLRGGGKRAVPKAESSNIEEDMLDFLGVKLTVEPNDIDPVKKALGLPAVNVEGWIQSLSLDDTMSILADLDEQKKTGMLKTLTEPYCKYVNEYKALLVMS